MIESSFTLAALAINLILFMMLNLVADTLFQLVANMLTFCCYQQPKNELTCIMLSGFLCLSPFLRLGSRAPQVSSVNLYTTVHTYAMFVFHGSVPVAPLTSSNLLQAPPAPENRSRGSSNLL